MTTFDSDVGLLLGSTAEDIRLAGSSQSFIGVKDGVYKICHPTVFKGNTDAVITPPMTRGFQLFDSDAGSLALHANTNCIKYTHSGGRNLIMFTDYGTGKRGFIVVDNIPIHHHGDMTQGGPAYGTYYTEDDRQQES